MPDQFEQAFADIAYSYLQEKVPNLMEFLVGFEVVDKDDSGAKGLGLFAFKIGDRYLYCPVFFLNAELKPLELLWLKDKDIFVPLDEDWVSYLLKNKPLVLGEETEERHPRFDVPDLDLFAQPPITGKHVTAEAREVFSAMAHGAEGVLAELQQPSTKGLQFLKKAECPVKQAFLQEAVTNPNMLQALGRFYDLGQVKAAAQTDAPNYRMAQGKNKCSTCKHFSSGKCEKFDFQASAAYTCDGWAVKGDEAQTKVASLQDPDLLRQLSPEQREKVYRGELVFASDPLVLTKYAQLYATQFEKDLQNPHTSGVYTLISHTGDLRKALVLLAPQATHKYGERKATVIDLQTKRFVCAPVGRIWTKKLAEEGESPDLDEESEIPDALMSDRTSGSVGTYYVLMNPALHSSAPFEILQKFKDTAGLVHYRVKFVEGDMAYTHDTTHSRAGNRGYTENKDPQTDINLSAEQQLSREGEAVSMTLAPETAGGADKMYSMGDELVVPKSFKLIKLTKPSKSGPEFALGDEAAVHNQIFNVTKEAGLENRLIRIGLKHDGVLYCIENSHGSQHRSLTKAAAAGILANDFFMRPDQVLDYIKQAEQGRGRFHELWAVQRATDEELEKKAIRKGNTGTRKGGAIPFKGGFASQKGGLGARKGDVFAGRGASTGNTLNKTRQMMQQTAQQAKRAQIEPLPQGIPDPIFTSDNSVAPGGKQLFNEELIPLPNVYEPPRPMGGVENMYTGPSGLPGEQTMGPPPDMQMPQGNTPQMDTDLAMQAADMGQQTVFDHSVLASLAKLTDVSELINQYLPDLEAALDKLGRLLFLYWWHQEQFKESFGITQMRDLEDQLRSVFKSFGELVLDLKQKEQSRSAPMM